LIQVLAIDPGSDAGGAALLSSDGRRVVSAWAWKERKRKGEKFYEITYDFSRPPYPCSALVHVGPEIAAGRDTGAPYALVVEGLFVGTNKKTSMSLEWSAGLIASPLAVHARGDIMRPTSMQWRPEIVGIPGNTNAKVAADMAIRWVAQNLPGMGALADNEHACEAACQALYGWRLINGKIA
jgi:hypothetical protein